MAAADREKVKEKVQAALPEVSSDQVDDYIGQAEEYFYAKTGLQEGGGQQAVSSIKRGDTTIEYSSGSGSDSGSGLSGLDARIAMFKVAKIR